MNDKTPQKNTVYRAHVSQSARKRKEPPIHNHYHDLRSLSASPKKKQKYTCDHLRPQNIPSSSYGYMAFNYEPPTFAQSFNIHTTHCPLMIDSPHGILTIDELKNINIKQRNVCYVKGLPSDINSANQGTLKSRKWFGQFGKIIKMIFPVRKQSAVLITFKHESSASDAIHYCNNGHFEKRFKENRRIKATFGMQQYCPFFIEPNINCKQMNCRLRHSWCRNDDIFTNHDIKQFEMIPYGLMLPNDIDLEMIVNVLVDHNKQRKKKRAVPLPPKLVNSPYGMMTKTKLKEIQLIQKNVCFVTGLPPNILCQDISSKQWFAQFGNIKKVSLRQNKLDVRLQSKTALITFDSESCAIKAINYCNTQQFVFSDGRKLKARFGSIRYCTHFLNDPNGICPSKAINDCAKIHSWQSTETENVITEDVMCKFRSIPYGIHENETGTASPQTPISSPNNNINANNNHNFEKLNVKYNDLQNEVQNMKKNVQSQNKLLLVENMRLKQEIANMHEEKKQNEEENVDHDINKLKFVDWLNNVVRLKKYLPVFEEHGYDDITMIEFFDEDVIVYELGINKKLHYKLIMRRVNEYKAQINQLNIFLDTNKTLKLYERQLRIHGIITMNDLRRDIKTKQDVEKVFGFNDNDHDQMQKLLKIIQQR